MFFVSAVTPDFIPPNTPAIHIPSDGLQIIRSLEERLLSTASRVTNLLLSGRFLIITFLAVDFVGIKCMQRLSDFVLNKIRNINNIVYRIQSNCPELVFQPVGRFSDCYPAYCYSCIPWTVDGVFDNNLVRIVVIIGFKVFYRWTAAAFRSMPSFMFR